MQSEKWTAATWYKIAMALEAAAGNMALPAKVRRSLEVRAEAAWVTGDWMRGITPQMWEEECRIYQAEDDAMVARNAELQCNISKPTAQLELEIAH